LIKHLFSFPEKRTKEELTLIRFVIDRFGYRPKNISIFINAITHKSLLTHEDYSVSNERLEFLGDSIIGSIVAEWLYHKFPKEDEGYLTRLKSKIVSRKTLGNIACLLDLKSIIKYKSNRSINLSSIEGNCLEALFGAMYLDGGYEAVKKSLIQHVYRKYVDMNKMIHEETDFKSILFILCQKNKWDLEFYVEKEIIKNAIHIYDIRASINGNPHEIGQGYSKKEAEQLACKKTLEKLGEI
jgi:ribonuclease-3